MPPTARARTKSVRPTPAPGRLKIVQDFVNTADFRAERDGLRTPQALTTWLVRNGLVPSIQLLDEDEWRRALEVREGLRYLLRVHRGKQIADEALERLNEAIGETEVYVQFECDGSAALKSSQTGWDQAAATLIEVILHATAQGHWKRLKTCSEEKCRRLFYDSSKSAREEYCNGRRCGGEVDLRACRSHHAGERASGPSGPQS